MALTTSGMVATGLDATHSPRPRPQQAYVIADLHEASSQGVEGTAGLHQAVMGGQGLKLVGGGDEGQARVLRHLHRRGEVCVGGWGGGEGGEAKPRQDRRSGDVREGVVLGAVCHTGHPHAFRILHTSKSKPFYLFAVFR